jgi:hypothetical protein
MTAAERAAIDQRAAAAGVTPSAFAAEVLRNGRVVVQQQQTLAPALMAELSRIGNNINQLAHAANASSAPPQAQALLTHFQELWGFMMNDEIMRRRVEAFDSRGRSNDSAPARPRDEFQGRSGLPVPR